RQLLGEV
ncbi:MAG: hypothetical protein HLUCCX21_04205, partial [Porphyrobacter sp. HL-46]